MQVHQAQEHLLACSAVVTERVASTHIPPAGPHKTADAQTPSHHVRQTCFVANLQARVGVAGKQAHQALVGLPRRPRLHAAGLADPVQQPAARAQRTHTWTSPSSSTSVTTERFLLKQRAFITLPKTLSDHVRVHTLYSSLGNEVTTEGKDGASVLQVSARAVLRIVQQRDLQQHACGHRRQRGARAQAVQQVVRGRQQRRGEAPGGHEAMSTVLAKAAACIQQGGCG